MGKPSEQIAQIVNRISEIVPRRLQKLIREVTVSSALTSTLLVGVAAAQQANTDICSSPIANLVNAAAPVVIQLLMVGGFILAIALHLVSGFMRDPSKIKEYKQWRTRSVFSVIGAYPIAWVLQYLLNKSGAQLLNCMHVLPF